jgi:hypothetical protein
MEDIATLKSTPIIQQSAENENRMREIEERRLKAMQNKRVPGIDWSAINPMFKKPESGK